MNDENRSSPENKRAICKKTTMNRKCDFKKVEITLMNVFPRVVWTLSQLKLLF